MTGGCGKASLGLLGDEVIEVKGITTDLTPKKEVTVTATASRRTPKSFRAIARLDSEVDVDVYRSGGILRAVLNSFKGSEEPVPDGVT